MSLYVPLDLDETEGDGSRPAWASGMLSAQPEEVKKTFDRYVAHGVSEFVVTIRGRATRDVDCKIKSMERLATVLVD